MIPKKDATRLPWNMYKFLNRKPSIFSSAKDKYLYKLLIVWLNEQDDELSQSYVDEANIIDCLHWKDYRSYTNHRIGNIELKFKNIIQ